MTTLAPRFTPTATATAGTIVDPPQLGGSGTRPRRPPSVGAWTPWDPAEEAISAITEQLFGQRAELPEDHPAQMTLRDRIIEANLPMSRRLARRYAGRGELLDDLAQVAALALVKAVDGYDPIRGTPFIGYAVPTITGALKRHFRDSGWAIRVPRSTQEMFLAVRAANVDLSLRGHEPTPIELAGYLQAEVGEVTTALLAANMYRLDSLDTPRGSNEDGTRTDLAQMLGATDRRYADIDNRLVLNAIVAALPARERRILTMRFYAEMTQAGIAAEIGISQMHVSRLLRQSLTRLRVGMLAAMADTPAAATTPIRRLTSVD
jgi:RNA polymerase sigma-B factor